METTLRTRIIQAIRGRDISTILGIMFEPRQPVLKDGFYHESDLWDFKRSAPGHGRTNEIAWANIAADVLAFHNKEGGIIFFGIDDSAHSFCGTPTDLDSKKFNDKLRMYVGDAFWVTYSKEFGKSGLHLGVVVIPKRAFSMHVAMAAAPTATPGTKPYFEAGDLCIREGDETKVLRGDKAEDYDKAIEIFKPLLDSGFQDTNAKTIPLLKECYEKSSKRFELMDLRTRYPEFF